MLKMYRKPGALEHLHQGSGIEMERGEPEGTETVVEEQKQMQAALKIGCRQPGQKGQLQNSPLCSPQDKELIEVEEVVLVLESTAQDLDPFRTRLQCWDSPRDKSCHTFQEHRCSCSNDHSSLHQSA